MPGHHYEGDAPDAFAHYSEVIRYLEVYADAIEAPLRCGVNVASLRHDPATGRFRIATPDSALEASRVVIGFDFDWVRLPILDDRGAPVQRRGVTSVPGAYFLGLHWMHKFKSGTLWGVGEDAQYLAEHMRSSK